MPANNDTVPRYELELRDFIRQYMETANTNAREESGNGGATFDMRALDRMSEADMLRFVKEKGLRPAMEGGNSRMGEVAIGDDDPLVAQFLQQHGARDWGNVEAPDSGNRRARGFVMGYGDPGYRGEGAEGKTILADGTRVLKLPDGRYIREEANINSDEVAGQQRADETQYRQSMQALGRVVAGPVIGAAAGYLGAAGDMASVMEAAPGQGFGTAASTSSNLGGAVGATGAVPGGGSGPSSSGQPQIDYGEAPTSPGSGTAPRVDIPGDMTLNAGPPGGGTGTPLVEPPGIIGQSNPSLLSRATDWYSSLSPASRYVLGTAVSQGASALLQGAAQREQQQSVEEQREQERQDRVRRGYIPAFGSAFTRKQPGKAATPKPGILASRRGG